ncbi:hypothetical protein [Sphingobacterium sp.]|uniref:hypothetical protein n=1 Tax=Sphingobacterium sp. TaxID=341027 RepID=UPI00289EEC41|nr:hypothetical protein [Sphingobacterium sp.]
MSIDKTNNYDFGIVGLGVIGRNLLLSTQASLREALKDAIANGISVSRYVNALAYFDAYRSEKLPTNIIQAQRGYFGARTYERIDQEGIFHTLWD